MGFKMRTEQKQVYIAIEDKQEDIPKLIPNVSEDEDYNPDGYEFVEDLFVDNFGCGGEGELALTRTQFIAEIKKGYGYAITGVGQFQVHVSVYKKRKAART